MDKLWLQFACYAGALVISLGLQVSRPDLFAIFCTPQKIGNLLQQRLDIPLNSPVIRPTGGAN